jgi:hypothetical protein
LEFHDFLQCASVFNFSFSESGLNLNANQIHVTLSYNVELAFHFKPMFNISRRNIMRTFFRITLVTALLMASFIVYGFGFKEGKIEKSFKNVKEVKIKTVSGDCIIKKGSNDEVVVVLTYSYD